MGYQKFIPEGWSENLSMLLPEDIPGLVRSGEIKQGYVTRCDDNYNLYVDIGTDLVGVIPREEVEAVNIEETGFPKPNICMNKVNHIVQFKVKDYIQNDTVILSRKEVGKEALNWVKQDLKQGQIVHGIVKNIRPYGVFVEIRRGNGRIIAY